MVTDPFQHFLGVTQSAEPAALLGLSPAQSTFDPVEIETALRVQLARVFQHPHGRSAEADFVRRSLRKAADELKEQAAQRTSLPASNTLPGPSVKSALHRAASSAPMFNLTAFDRMVLAVLVGSGGWNAESRARLVALASAYGVSVQGLMRVVNGLSDYARAGGTRLGVSEITAGQPLSTYLPPSPSPSAAPALLERLTESLSTELKRDDPWPTIKLSAIFGLITIAICIIGLRIAFTANTPSQARNSNDAAKSPINAVTLPSPAPPVQPTEVAAADPKPRVAIFPAKPTFLGNALPHDALTAAADLGSLGDKLSESARKLVVEDNPSDAIYHQWAADINTIASAWTLSDASTKAQLEKQMFEALRSAGDRPSVSDRMLSAFMPPAAIAEPIEIWRGAWKIGTLARIATATSTSLPPVVIQRAREMLEASMKDAGVKSPESIEQNSMTFEIAADTWLATLVPQMVGTIEVNEQAFDAWELWLAAERALGRGDRHDTAVMRAMAAVLATGTDLARPGRTVDVLGRLLAVALESSSDIVRQQLHAFFDNEQITSRDLWVLTSLLAASDTARWFPDRLIVPDDADQRHRWRLRDEIDAAWPNTARAARNETVPAGRAILVDAKVASRWSALLDAQLQQPPGDSAAAVLRQLVIASRLVEAADALAAQNPTHADRVLDELEAMAAAPSPGSAAPKPTGAPMTNPIAPMPPPLQPAGVRPSRPASTAPPSAQDAGWAVNYQQNGKTTEQRIDLLRSLRSAAGTDLGPMDADVFVREVYRASPSEVRLAAQEIVPQFANGPIVAMAMLDQFADAPATDAIAKVIGDFTNQPLPGPRSSTWNILARLALLQHALQLLPEGRDENEQFVSILTDVFTMRLSLLRREPAPSAAAAKLPQDAARLVAQAWLEQAETAIVAQPAPDTLPALNRRRATRLRLADGPIQNFVAQQLAVLDLLTYVTVAEQPARREAAMNLLRSAADLRAGADSIFEQSMLIERAVAAMWKLRMGLAEQVVMRQGQEPRFAADQPAVFPASAPNDLSAAQTKWASRLEQLSPGNPLGYFELAEEVADAANDPAQTALARRLFGLSGVLDPARFGRSACLALADLEPNEQPKRKLLALATLLGPTMNLGTGDLGDWRKPSMPSGSPETGNAADAPSIASADPQAVIAVCDALGYYRRGQGSHALEALRKPGATELLQQCDRFLPGGASRILDDCKHYKGQARPMLSSVDLIRMWRLQIALLSGEDRSWSSDQLLTGGKPLVEVDPDRLQEMLGIDGSRPYFHHGRWMSERAADPQNSE